MQSNHITIIVLGLLLFGVSLVFTTGPEARTGTRTAALTLPSLFPAKQIPPPVPAEQSQPEIEVVFVLDTTGSMGGLIQGAKQKIWSVINELKQGQPEPNLKIGLVGYRDRGDAYITRHSPLTHDIDTVYSDLMAYQAAGGGDTPESVNQALHEAVTRVNWSRNPNTLRVIFLVGDAPPKMNYQDDVPYTTTSALARERDIILNTIQCGNMSETTAIWKSIAQMGHGGYAAIRQDGGMVVASSPYDEQIETLNRAISGTVIPYGNRRQKEEARRKMDTAGGMDGYAAAERQMYVSASEPSAAITGRGDLLADISNKHIELDDLSKDELPEDYRDLDKPALEEEITQKVERRRELQNELSELLEKRKDYLADAAEDEEADAFDTQVKEMVRQQAARKSITY